MTRETRKANPNQDILNHNLKCETHTNLSSKKIEYILLQTEIEL